MYRSTYLLIAVSLLSQGYADINIDNTIKEFITILNGALTKLEEVKEAREDITLKSKDRIRSAEDTFDNIFATASQTIKGIGPKTVGTYVCYENAGATLALLNGKYVNSNYANCIRNVIKGVKDAEQKATQSYKQMQLVQMYYQMRIRSCQNATCREDQYKKDKDAITKYNKDLQTAAQNIIANCENIDEYYNQCDNFIDYYALDLEIDKVINTFADCYGRVTT